MNARQDANDWWDLSDANHKDIERERVICPGTIRHSSVPESVKPSRLENYKR